MGAAFSCHKEVTTKEEQNSSPRKRSLSSAEHKEEKILPPIQKPSTLEDEKSITPDSTYFEKLALFLDILPNTNRLPTDEIIVIVKTNPRYAANIVSLILLLESNNILIHKKAVIDIAQQGQYAKDLGNAIFQLIIHKIQINKFIIIQLYNNPEFIKQTVDNLIKEKQKADMDLFFTELYVEKRSMDAELEKLGKKLQKEEEKIIKSLASHLAVEQRIITPSSPAPASPKQQGYYYPYSDEASCCLFSPNNKSAPSSFSNSAQAAQRNKQVTTTNGIRPKIS